MARSSSCDGLLELREAPPALCCTTVVRARRPEQVLARPQALHVAERRVLVEVELERLADRHLGEVEVREGT